MLQIATPKQSTSSPDSSRNVTIYIKSDSIVRQTNKVHLLSYTTMNNKHIFYYKVQTPSVVIRAFFITFYHEQNTIYTTKKFPKACDFDEFIFKLEQKLNRESS